MGPRDANGPHRGFTAEELDALVDFSWHGADVKGSLAAYTNAILSRVRLRASNPTEPTRLPSVGATSHV
jgi:hypothetical protein